jgi:hypothetical protein
MEMTWEGEELLKKVEALAIVAAEKAAKREEQWLKATVPVYQGPPRASGRKPGTLRDGIKAEKLRKWSRVFVPYPGAYVEYGGKVVEVTATSYRVTGTRAPRPFIRPTLKPITQYFEKLHKNKL